MTIYTTTLEIDKNLTASCKGYDVSTYAITRAIMVNEYEVLPKVAIKYDNGFAVLWDDGDITVYELEHPRNKVHHAFIPVEVLNEFDAYTEDDDDEY